MGNICVQWMRIALPHDLMFKGAGGVDDPGKVEIELTVVPDRGECQLPDTFYQIKKYCS